MVVGEFRFHVFERAIDRQFAFQRVDDDGMPDRFEIQNIGKIQPHLPLLVSISMESSPLRLTMSIDFLSSCETRTTAGA